MKCVCRKKGEGTKHAGSNLKRLAACFFVLVMLVAAVPGAAGISGIGADLLGAAEAHGGGTGGSIPGITISTVPYYGEVGSKNNSIEIEVKNSSVSDISVNGQLTTEGGRASRNVTITSATASTNVPADSSSYMTFKVDIPNAAEAGDQTLTLRLESGGVEATYNIIFEVMEKTSSPASGSYIISTDMDVTLSNPDGIVPGETTTITLTLYNRSNSVMKGTSATIKLPEGLYISSGSSSQSMGYIAAGNSKSATFSVSADEDIEGKSYAIDVAIECKDSGNGDASFTQTIYVPVQGAESKSYTLDSIDIINVSMPSQIEQEESCELRFTVKNSGSKTVHEMQVKAEIPEGLINTTRTLFTINSLEPGASQDFSVTVAATDKTEEQFYAVKLTVESTSSNAKGTTTVTQYTGTYVKELDKATGSEKTPQLMVSSYTYGGLYVQAGSNFSLNLGLLNTSSSDIYNIKVTVSSDDGSIIPINSASFHLDQITKKTAANQAVAMSAKRDADEKTVSLTVDMSYEDKDGNEFTSKDNISVPILQDTRLVLGEFSTPRDVMVGNQSRSTIEFYNMGQTTLKNLRISASGNFTTENSNFSYAGNMSPGAEDSYSFNFTPIEEGMVTGAVTFTYENASGNAVTLTQPFEFAVMEMPSWDEEEWFDPFPAEEEKSLPWYTIGFGATIVVVIIAVLIFKKLKKSKLDKELEIDE